MAKLREVVLHPQYVVDEHGEKRSVMLSIEEYERVMEIVEDLNDAAALDEAISHSRGTREFDLVVEELKRDQLL